MKKNLLFKNTAMHNLALFRCPICGGTFEIRDLTFFCINNHTFDISKKGYVNFVLNGKIASYDKALFIERKETAKAGFFEQLNEVILALIRKYNKGNYILDAGCGEGSTLNTIISQSGNCFGVGIDISKDAIMQTEQTDKSVFLVGDIAHLPIQSDSIDVLLNILTPAHYSEFSRVLKEGILIKVIPNSNYLQEIRSLYYADSSKKKYSNDTTVEHFYKNFKCLEEINCTYQFRVNDRTLGSILRMTPLLWNIDDKAAHFTESGIESITCDFKILVGQVC